MKKVTITFNGQSVDLVPEDVMLAIEMGEDCLGWGDECPFDPAAQERVKDVFQALRKLGLRPEITGAMVHDRGPEERKALQEIFNTVVSPIAFHDHTAKDGYCEICGEPQGTMREMLSDEIQEQIDRS